VSALRALPRDLALALALAAAAIVVGVLSLCSAAPAAPINDPAPATYDGGAR
jgi:hypothetical protein